MSIEQHQRNVFSLDKDIAALEKKKAAADKKAADAQRREAGISISKNASSTTVKNKMRQAEGYRATAIKASAESANLAKKIVKKRKKRNEEAQRLQKEQEKEQKKQATEAKRMQEAYEQRIKSLQQQTIAPSISAGEEQIADIPEFDVFVSHAWENKKDFLDEFVDALRTLGIKVWYDTSQIKWGDSMRKHIDDGLKKSRFGVAILSPNYLAEGKYWTKAELDGLFQLESVNGKTLLPIWHNLTKKEVMAYSPIIASKLAMSTATMTPQEIADEHSRLLNDNEEQ